MIGVENQFLLSFSVADNIDFINERDLQKYKAVEYAGGRLPVFELGFITRQEGLLAFLNEGNILSVFLGKSDKDRNPQDTQQYTITKMKSFPMGDNQIFVEIKGQYHSIKYQADTTTYISPDQSAIETLLERAALYFPIIDTNIERSFDKQRWIQPNITSKKFFQDTYLHADLPESYPLMAITAEGRFILRDIKTLLQSDAQDWQFTAQSSGSSKPAEKDIPYLGDYINNQNTGFLNENFGYSKLYDILTMSDGSTNNEVSSMIPFIARTSKLIQSNELSNTFKGHKILTGNTHANYWKSYLRNLVYLTLTSIARIDLSFDSMYRNIKPLDLAIFKENKPGESTSSEHFSGRYIVSRVAKVVEERKLTTNLKLCREGINSPEGDFPNAA